MRSKMRWPQDYAFAAQSQGTLVQQPMPPAPPKGSPVYGNRVNFALTPAGTLRTGDFQQLLRVMTQQHTTWQVTLAPVFRQVVGPSADGQPQVTAGTGAPVFRMKWGAGGQTFETGGQYPVGGASFTVSADTIDISVAATDGVTVFTADTLPGVNAWVVPANAAQAAQSLFAASFDAALVGPFTVAPFARALWVFANTAGATLTVTLTSASGTQTIVVPSGTRVPLGGGITRFSVVASAGNCSATQELSFA